MVGLASVSIDQTRTIKSEQAVYDFGLQGFWEEVAQSNGRTRRRDTYTVKLTKLLSRVPSVQHLPLPGVLPHTVIHSGGQAGCC